jgi:CDP-diacylglycerol--glycerol-3-phosphate 3-phosphatidyltransferase
VGPGGSTDHQYGPSAIATPANGVTVLRLLIAPILFALIGEDGATWAVFAFWVVLSASDAVDGFMARRHGTTRSGAFLDPLADKVLVLGAMFALVSIDRFALLPVALIAAREIFISLYRMWWGRRGLAIPARPSAKLKTALQTLAVGAALLPWLGDAAWVADGLLWASVAVALFSAWEYVRDGSRATTTMGG